MPEQTKKTRTSVDEKYKSAAQDVVDEKMRIDNFAPMILNAVESDVKLRNGIKTLVAEAVTEKPEVQKAINAVVDQNRTNKIYKILVTAPTSILQSRRNNTARRFSWTGTDSGSSAPGCGRDRLR